MLPRRQRNDLEVKWQLRKKIVLLINNKRERADALMDDDNGAMEDALGRLMELHALQNTITEMIERFDFNM